MDDYSNVCRTPLALDACNDHGPVLVYYSYKPYANSRLVDFAAASAHAYRIGIPTIAISLPLYVLACGVIAIVIRKGKGKDDPDFETKKAEASPTCARRGSDCSRGVILVPNSLSLRPVD